VQRTHDAALAEHLKSGWSAVLKPLAWQGHLCNGPADGNRVTFTCPDSWIPDWPGIPEPEQAARVAIPGYLGVYGPASMEAFDQWLSRGATKRATLRGWFADLAAELVTVDVAGRQAFARAVDVDEIASTRPTDVVRLLPAFDQYVLSPGTGDPAIIPAARRAQVSKAAGWISPVVVAGGRVAGTWELDDSTVQVKLFGAGEVADDPLTAEVDRIGGILGRPLQLAVQTS